MHRSPGPDLSARLHSATPSRSRGHLARFIFGVLLAILSLPRRAFALNPGKAVTQYVLATYGTEAGLPQSSVHAIAQTPDGYLWAGTQDGLARFDGLRFKAFSNRDSDLFRENFVSALHVDRTGTLWVGTDDGTLLRYANGRFERGPALAGHSNGIRAMCETPDGSLFVASLGNGLHRIAKGEVTPFTKNEGLPDDVVMAVACGADGDVWIGTAAGLARFERGAITRTADTLVAGAIGALELTKDGKLWVGTVSGEIVQVEGGRAVQRFGPGNGLPPLRITALRSDRDENLWIGTEGRGIVRFRFGSASKFGKAEGLTDDAAVAIFEDREGSVWIGTEAGGLNVLKESRFVTWGAREGLLSDDVSAIIEAHDGSIFLGGHDGLNRLLGGQIATLSPKGATDWIVSLLEDTGGAIWVGSMRGPLLRYQGDRLEPVPMPASLPRKGNRSIYKDRSGVVWAGAPRHLLRLENDQWSTVEIPGVGTAILAVMGDRAGGLWIGTYAEGVRRRAPDGSWSAFTTADGLSNDMVIGFYEDPEGAIWIATHGGLTRHKDGRLRAITARDGLYHDAVYQVLDDGLGYLWMCSDRGISKTPKSELDAVADGRAARVSHRSFGLSDGMRSVECNNGSPSGFRGKDGRLYFATLGGAVVVDPRLTTFGAAPRVVLEEVIANGKVIDVNGASPNSGRPIEIAPGLKNLEIQYATPTFTDPTHVSARYRLEGFDPNWIDAGLRRTAYYTNLPPGQYRFRVDACNADGTCSESPVDFSFRLLPRFYETVGFWIAVASALVAATWASVRYRIRQVEKANAVLEERVKERTAQLSTALSALEEKDNRIQEDLKQAEAFQRALLPALPEDDQVVFSALYEPAEVVGGDIYDIAKIGQDVFRVFIADTTGHGVQASLRTIAIKTEYDRLKSVEKTPGELLSALNRRLVNNFDGGVCCSACCIDIQVENGKLARLVYANAAHPEILLFGRETKPLYTPGMYLGFTTELDYPNSTVEIAPGGSVLLYSDGATEIDSANDGMLGSDRLGEMIAQAFAADLTPEDALRRVRADMAQFSSRNGQAPPLEDDLTLILVSLKGGAGSA